MGRTSPHLQSGSSLAKADCFRIVGSFERGDSQLSLEIDTEGVPDVVPHGAVAADAVPVGPLRVELHSGRVDVLDERMLTRPELEPLPDKAVSFGGDVRPPRRG